MPKNWKYIKKLLEKEFLCEKLRGHITYDLTDYKPAPWNQQHFIMKYDDEILLDVSQPKLRWDKRYKGREISWGQRDVISKKLYEKYNLDQDLLPSLVMSGIVEDIIDEVDKINFHYQGVFGVEDIMDAIATYLHSDIETNLGWAQDEFIIALAILDRRCGKRRLEEYANWNYSGFPEWLRRICQIRFDAERIRYNKHYEIAKTHNVHFESEKSNIKK